MAILFIDIETVPLHASYQELSDKEKSLWDYKAGFLIRDESTPEEIYQRAGIYAEFGKVIVISLGWLSGEGEEAELRVKTLANDDEKELLSELINILVKIDNTNTLLCGHNIKEFDVPFLCRRILINQLKLPDLLDVSSKKPWQTPYLDTLELWKFGDRKHYTKLDLLAHVFEIPSSKDDIDGSEVYKTYYEENDLNRIAIYCEKDVILTCQLYLRLNVKPLLSDEQIVRVDAAQ
ncbi:3'-5' exonuclease [Marivirga atlantica]|jgi:predicted PolB exonuclease-like 3'-5' exonuclease|uniref:3'-5' exonuclease n=1 Tax=Marivirga atlantica TaxID=1548457 RepID=A0A937DFH9_9BACT|nr:3'-5' exonuclease [Marivirga atlantica]MBL0766232.1 3'-5' exonuclease [Marivirga atlantica]